LESLRSGGNRPASVLVYEPPISQSRDTSSKEVPPSKAQRELATWFIKALYRPNSSPEQMQTLANTLRSTAHIAKVQISLPSHVIVVRGTSEQLTQADSLINE
jgi:hypothetical protein